MKRTYFLTILLGMFFAHIGVANADVGTILRNVPDEARCCFVKGTKEVEQMKVLPVGKTTSKTFSIPLSQVGKVQSLVISGNIKKTSKDYVVRIILKDKERGEHLVLESYEEIHSGINAMDFSNYGEETFMLEKGVYADSLKICIKDAEVSLKSVAFASEMNEKLDIASNRKMQVQSVVDRINTYCKENNKLWRAKVTPGSLESYEVKKRVLGLNDEASSLGFEYYGGGIFEVGSKETDTKKKSVRKKTASVSTPTTSRYVDHFDWRYRHRKNWITPVKDQGTSSSCTYYASTGMLEALVNLYFNDTINLDLSEQYIINNCKKVINHLNGREEAANTYENVLDYLKYKSGFLETRYGTRPQLTDSTYQDTIISFHRYSNLGLDSLAFDIPMNIILEDSIKKALIHSGPLASGIWEGWGHAMVLVGYGKISAGDTIRFTDPGEGDDYDFIDNRNNIYIQEGHPLIGKTYWIFKNSGGENFTKYVQVIVRKANNIAGPYKAVLPIRVQKLQGNRLVDVYSRVIEDRDNDGYYNWGIGSRPSNLPSYIPCEEDWDDADSTIGPVDSYGIPTINLNPDDRDTIYVTDDDDSRLFESFVSDTARVHNHIVIATDYTLISNIHLYSGAKCIVRAGNTLEIFDGGSINGEICIEPGATVRQTEGDIIIPKNKKFMVPIGTTYHLENGSIK